MEKDGRIMKEFNEAAKDFSFGEILASVFVEGYAAVKVFDDMKKRGEDVSYVEESLEADNVPISFLRERFMSC